MAQKWLERCALNCTSDKVMSSAIWFSNIHLVKKFSFSCRNKICQKFMTPFTLILYSHYVQIKYSFKFIMKLNRCYAFCSLKLNNWSYAHLIPLSNCPIQESGEIRAWFVVLFSDQDDNFLSVKSHLTECITGN